MVTRKESTDVEALARQGEVWAKGLEGMFRRTALMNVTVTSSVGSLKGEKEKVRELVFVLVNHQNAPSQDVERKARGFFSIKEVPRNIQIHLVHRVVRG